MEDKFVVYKTIYNGTVLPKYYIGSTSYKKIIEGYRGSVSSKKWKSLFQNELKNNPHLFEIEILETCDTRKEALELELKHQEQNDILKNDDYMNESYARVNGYFGNTYLKTTKDKFWINDGINEKISDTIPEGWVKGMLHSTTDNVKGRIWVNDGNKSKMVDPDKIPDGYVLGRCKNDKSRISKAITGVRKSWRWITKIDTDESKRLSKEQPLPDGYKEGRNRKISESMSNAKIRKFAWYYNPITEEAKRVYEDESVPDGFIKGRGTSFSNKVKSSINKK